MSERKSEHCPDCYADLKTEVVGDYRDVVCEDCGLIVQSNEIVENQVEWIEEDVEVMQ